MSVSVRLEGRELEGVGDSVGQIPRLGSQFEPRY